MIHTLEQLPENVKDDWENIVLRPGINVLSTMIYHLRTHAKNELMQASLDTMEKVEHRRGQIVAYDRIINFVKSEIDRAAKGQTTVSKEDGK